MAWEGGNVRKKLQGPGPVLRVRVEGTSEGWRVLKRLRIPSMTVPPSFELPQSRRFGRHSGFWFEATDAKNRTVYRQLLPAPKRGVEVFEADGAIRSLPAERDRIIADLLIPDLPEVKSIRLFLVEPERLPAPEQVRIGAKTRPTVVFPAREVKPAKKRASGR